MDLRPLHARAATCLWTLYFVQRNCKFGFLDFGKPIGELARGAAWRVFFFGVRVINDLPVRNIFCRHLGKFLQEDCRQRKVSNRQNAALDLARDIIYLGVIVSIKT